MPWNLDSSRPIYLQIIERVQMDIITGRYQPGDKLPSVRDLAQEAAVNPNTMQKALSELERSGLIYSQRTSGRFITEDKELIHQMKKELAAAEAEDKAKVENETLRRENAALREQLARLKAKQDREKAAHTEQEQEKQREQNVED